jgi:hypothetical protein
MAVFEGRMAAIFGRPATRRDTRNPVEEPHGARLHQQRICRRTLSRIPAGGRCRHRRGPIRYREDIVNRMEKAPEAFTGMLEGRNFDKLIVRVDA